MSYCVDCGTKLRQNANFCTGCGKRVHSQVQIRVVSDGVTRQKPITVVNDGLNFMTLAWSIYPIAWMMFQFGSHMNPLLIGILGTLITVLFAFIDYSLGLKTNVIAKICVVLCVPVYIWQRCTSLRKSKGYFAWYLVMCVLDITVTMVIAIEHAVSSINTYTYGTGTNI